MAEDYIQLLTKAVDNFVSIQWKDRIQTYSQVLSSIHEMCDTIYQCEMSGFPKNDLLKIIEPAIEIHSRSPFIKRMQEWPRGYPGDFETVEYLYYAIKKSPKESIEIICEEYALNCSASQQHRNKVHQQTKCIIDAIEKNPHAKILSLAAGGCIDIKTALKHVNSTSVKFVLNDIDNDALEFSRNRLNGMIGNYIYVNDNAIRAIKKIKTYGQFDLILIGGLFDYLSDKHVVFLLKHVFKMLNNKGKIFFTNIDKGNPYRIWIEYFGDWVLIERDANKIVDLIKSALDFQTLQNTVFRKIRLGLRI